MKPLEALKRLIDMRLVCMTRGIALLHSHAGFPGSPLLTRFTVVAFFLGYLVAQSPHLVHHLFAPDEVQPQCAYLAAADHHQVTPVDVPSLFSESAPVSTVTLAREARHTTRDPGATGARAPPATF